MLDISWFMRLLNETIVRLALLDETTVLACMAYLDLNPIRAQMAATHDASDFTCVQRVSDRR